MAWPADLVTRASLLTPANRWGGRLLAAVSPVATELTVAGELARLAPSGVVTVDDEIIAYAGIRGSTLFGCTRGSPASSHAANAPVQVRWVAQTHNGIAQATYEVLASIGTGVLEPPTVSVPPLVENNAGIGSPGIPGVGTIYPSVYPIGFADANPDAYVEFNQAVAISGNWSIQGATSAAPTLEAGNTRVRWNLTRTDDYIVILLENTNGPIPGTPFATSAGGDFPAVSTTFQFAVFFLGDPYLFGSPVIGTGQTIDLTVDPFPTYSEGQLPGFEWYKDGSPTGITTFHLQIFNAQPSDSGFYELYVNGSLWQFQGGGSGIAMTVI